jgi:hypothetical protein
MSVRLHRWLMATCATAGALSAGRVARAESPNKISDGVYGRFDGDLDLSLAAGGSATHGGSGGVAMLRASFLQTAGFYTAYTDAFGGATTGPPRTLALGIGLSPLFLPRWGLDMQHGPAVVDLTIDAITLDLGVVWPADAQGRFTQLPGLELALGTQIPLAGRAAGPWIGARGALRWSSSDLAGSSSASPALGSTLFVTFAWHFIANVHLVDVGDRIAR